MNSTNWGFLPHQIEDGEKLQLLLNEYKIALMTAEERTTKTGSIMFACELQEYKTVLVITTRAAIPGWQEHIENLPLTTNYHVVTHHGFDYAPRLKYDLIIIDESHRTFGGFPKAGKIIIEWHKTGIFANTPMTFISATMVSRTYSTMYHQLVLCDYSPFAKFKNFKDWFNTYGVPTVKHLKTRTVPDFNNTQGVWEALAHLVVDRTRKELGFEHEAQDNLIYIELSKTTLERYNLAVKDEILYLPETKFLIENKSAERAILQQLEGGTVKTPVYSVDPKDETKTVISYDNHYLSTEKIDYILEHYGDTYDLVIFYHFQNEFVWLQKFFKNARILQGISYSAGVDLSMHEKAVVYSMDYSTANYSQRRNRQVNIKRKTPIIVDYLLVKGGMSEDIYNVVAVNKVNFIDELHVIKEITSE